MSYLSHDGLAYFKYKLANWVDANYLSKTSTGPLTVNGDVTFTQPIHGDIDGRAKKDWKGQQIDQTYVADIVAEDGALQLINGAGNVLKTVFDTTVTQKRSTANELYPLLLCYDASAEVDQLHKTVWFGSNVRSNPYYGYVALKGLYVQDSTNYNRRSGSPSTKKEWAIDFTDGVQGLGNPMAQVYEYVDTAANGGEHHIELRLYGNPNSSPEIPAANDTTNTIHIGVGMTKGGAAPNGAPVKFGYCPSTPIYADNGTSFRTVGTDIITRDWLTLNGSITGLVHTTMDEVIDGNKTFKKTVVINSGNNNSPAGLQVQGDTNISGNETVGGNLTVAGKTTTQTFESKGDATVDGDLLVKGDETVNGNEHVKGNSTTDGNENVGGNINVEGAINKKSGNSTTEYVQYITNQPANRENIAANLIDTSKGLILTSNGKIAVNPNTTKGLAFGSDGKLYVDFSQIDTNTKADILAGLDVQIPIKSNIELIVDPGANNDTDDQNLKYEIRKSTPFTTIQGAVNWASTKLALGTRYVTIRVKAGTYREQVRLTEVNSSSGYITIESYSGNKDVIVDPGYRDSDGLTLSCITAGSGACKWALKHLYCKLRIHSTTTPGGAPCGIGAHTAGAVVYVYGCTVESILEQTTISGEGFSIRMIEAASGGQVHLFPDDKGSALISRIPNTDNTNSSYNVLDINRDGRIYFRRSTYSTNGTWACSGSCTNFINAWQSAGTNLLGGSGTQVAFTGSVSGRSVRAVTGSYIIAPSSGFPGDTEQNSIQTSTFCWAQGVD